MWHLLSLLSLTSGLTCPKYECASSTPTSLQCIKYESSSGSNVYKLTPCQLGLTCPYTEGSSTSCKEYPAFTRYPGDYCSVDIDCMSNNCLGTTCQGLNKNSQANCTTTADCEPGLYCEHTSNKCEEVKEEDDDDNDCSRDDECNNDNLCDLGSCTQMFSLDNDEQTNITWGYLAPLCKSGYAVKDKTSWNCTAAPQSVTPNKVQECPASGECTSKEGNITRPCQCGYDGKSYCPLFEGDSQVVSMISSWQALFKSSNYKCNGLNRWSYACFYGINPVAYENYLAWAVNASLYLNGTWYKNFNASSCVQQTVLIDFTNLQNDYDNSVKNYQECPAYEHFKNNSWPVGQCRSYSSNIYSSHPYTIYQSKSCSKDFMCSGSDGTNGTCGNITHVQGYPGDYCVQGANCKSNMCTSSRCKGVLVNQSCDSETKLCNPGLFCNSTNFCEDVNHSPSCAGNAQCNSSSVCLQGVCIRKFSLANGENTTLVQNSKYGFSEACTSGFGYLDQTLQVAKCDIPPVSSGSLLAKCYQGMTTKDSNGNYTEECVCGLSGQGSFPLFLGDGGHLSKVISSIKSLGSKTACYNNVWTVECVKHSDSLLAIFYEYQANYLNLTSAAYYHLADESTLEFYAADFYTATEYLKDEDASSSSSSYAGRLAALGMAYFILA